MDDSQLVAMTLPIVIIARAQDQGLEVPDLAAKINMAPGELVAMLAPGALTMSGLGLIAEALNTTPTALAKAAEHHLNGLQSTF